METADILRFFSTKWQRPKPIYYCLAGKRTISNLMAAKKGGYLNYFHCLPKLAIQDFEQSFRQLETQQLVAIQDENTQLTVKGQAWLKGQQLFTPPYYQGLFTPKLPEGLELLYLAIQVVSQASFHENRYIPVSTKGYLQQNIRHWYRRFSSQGTFVSQFKAELMIWLAALPETQANFVAANFVGHGFALTTAQLKTNFQYTFLDGTLMQLDALSLLLQQQVNTPEQFPLTRSLLAAYQVTNPLSHSTTVTYQQYLQGAPLSVIARNRRLKPSTVREHLLEAAILLPRFDFSRLSSQDDLPKNPYFTDRMQAIKESVENDN